MTDILETWLVDDVGLLVDNVSKDFSTGYMFGQLFYHYHLQPDFEKFEPRKNPDAMINNFTRLQPTFKKLGIQMDTRVANALMREEEGVALRLLYSVQQNLKKLNKDLQAFKSSGKLGQTYGVSVQPSRGFLESQMFNSSKDKHELNALRHFEDTLRASAANPNALMEAAHLHSYAAAGIRAEKAAVRALSAERAAQQDQRATFRKSALDSMSMSRTEKMQKLQHDEAVHAAIMKRKEELEREELRVELALSERARRKKLEELSHAALDVTHGIDNFEINMKRLVSADQGNGDDALHLAVADTPLEHAERLRSLAASTAALLQDTQAYMNGIREARQEDVASKKEREARRRKMIVEQQAAAAEAESKAAMDGLVATLARQSNAEQQLAARLWQLAQEKEVMVENRLFREQQYAERREKDWEETLRREAELHRSLHEEYAAQAKLEMDTWRAAQAEHEAKKKAKHTDIATQVAWQLVQLAERTIQYRNATGQLVPKREWREWLAMLISGDPNLGTPVVRDVPTPCALDPRIAQAAVDEYLACVGLWEGVGGLEAAVGCNSRLGQVIAELASLVRPVPPAPELPSIQLPLKLAVVGAPFSGKSTVCQELSRKFKLRVLDPESLVADAMKLAQEHEAAQAAVTVPPSTEPIQPELPQQLPEAAIGEPPLKVTLGLRARLALHSGRDVDDAILVALLVEAMKESKDWVLPATVDPKAKGKAPPKPPAKGATATGEKCQGFVIDGFPRTAAQAILLERALTGLDLDAEEAIISDASKLAPPPCDALPQTQRPLTSGLDAVVILSMADETLALKRALGRRLDPATGRVYHLEFDPPPSNDPGLSERLQEVKDSSNDAQQIQQRLRMHVTSSAPLDTWLKRFSRLRRPVDGAGLLNEVLQSCSDVAEAVLRAQAAATSARNAVEAADKARQSASQALQFAQQAQGHAEGAARELLLAKKTEIQAAALLTGGKNPDPAATELLKAQAASRCAEQLKVCRSAAADATRHAELAATAASNAADAAERANKCLGDAEISAAAEVDAKAAADDAAQLATAASEAAHKADAAKQAAQVAVAEAERLAQATHLAADVQLNLAPADSSASQSSASDAEITTQPADPLPVEIPHALAVVLHKEWQLLEQNYMAGLALGFSGLSEEHQAVVQHLAAVRQQFLELLRRPDGQAALVTKFQQDFNAVDIDVRRLAETKGELLLRCEELRDALWAECDRKMEEAEAERSRVAADTFVADHAGLTVQHALSLMQIEIDRFTGTINFFQSYASARFGVMRTEPDAPAVDLMSGSVPPHIKDKVDPKNKNAIQFAPYVAQLDPKLGTAVKVAIASARMAVAACEPVPEDPKKAKKEAGKKKGKDDTASDESVPKHITDAIAADVLTAARRELEILEGRIAMVANHALSQVQEITSLASSTHEKLGGWIKERYKAECSAAAAVVHVAKQAAASAQPLTSDLRLEGCELIIDEASQLVSTPNPPPPPKPTEKPAPAGLLTVEHMSQLVSAFQVAAPSGYMKLGEAADMLCRLAAAGSLPEQWRAASMAQMLSALRMYDPVFSGYMDWREFVSHLVITAFPVIACADCAEMADQVEMLSEADKDHDGFLTHKEWQSVELWFQYRTLKPGCSEDLEAEHAVRESRCDDEEYDRSSALKEVLWGLFAAEHGGAQLMDYSVVLLYLAADRDWFSGIKKALSVVTMSIASNARANPEQIYKVAYPLGSEAGQDISRAPIDRDALTAVVQTVYTSRGGKADKQPTVTAEQLMYTAAGERLVKQLMDRYQWKDAYIATKL